MHSEYLHRLFLHNQLASGRLRIEGRPVSLRDIRVPLFALGTETDHVAPWRSVYKIHDLVGSDVSFALTNGGHNAGIVSEPGHAHRHYRLLSKAAGEAAVAAQDWMAAAPRYEGSWWTAWQRWLVQHSSPRRIAPPPQGLPGQAPLGDAPGRYVLQR
jgi:polyhydroxyalkanoate synthase